LKDWVEEMKSPLPGPTRDAAGGGEGKEPLRDHLIRRFATWLDGVLAAEAPPAGVAAEILAELEREVDVEETASLDARSDMQGLWSALTALVQEIKLEGRAFRDLNENLEPLGAIGTRAEDALRAHGEALAEARRIADRAFASSAEREEAAMRQAERRGRRELIVLLLDLRDRLRRGLQIARGQQQAVPRPAGGSWLGRLLRRSPETSRESKAAGERVAALERGYSMTLERLDDGLAELGVTEVQCAGRPFDPRLMSAVKVEETDRVAGGTVLELYRAGYLWNDELLRTAQVKVSREVSPKEEEREEEE
jgi:molecular chaperone GrpE